MPRIFIAGGSGHGRVVCDVFRSSGQFDVVGFVDPNIEQGSRIGELPVLGRDDDIQKIIVNHNLFGFVTAVGDNSLRGRITEKFLKMAPLKLVAASHASAVVAQDVVIEPGAVIMAQAAVNPGCRIGRGCIVNTGATVEHDCVLDDLAQIGPAASLGGNCLIGARSFIGIGSTLIHGIRIGRDTVVGAGSLVLNELADNVVAYGVPAKFQRNRNESDSYL